MIAELLNIGATRGDGRKKLSPNTVYDRFIPAHAGNSWRQAPPRSWRAVHPRACGEQVISCPSCRPISGSSPRMRGTGSARAGHEPQARFIPAHAGNSREPTTARSYTAVHPRACGEQLWRAGGGSGDAGSSPRMRGTENEQVQVRSAVRFIPAHAGNSRVCASRPSRRAVHPRACGEQPERDVFTIKFHGSSPRMRGTGVQQRFRLRKIRFIPAHAGNSPAQVCVGRITPVHPRACGEQGPMRVRLLPRRGSSPRMRGTVWLEGIGSAAFWRCQRTYRSWRAS